ncbi:MAG: FAD-dependent oxidoreductase, partial [Planctomycetota bacterium]
MNQKVSRRTFVGAAAVAGTTGASLAQTGAKGSSTARSVKGDSFDVAVVGAGVFGAWTAWHLQTRGLRVALIDAYGPGSSRASSGGETRITRMGYGSQEIYTRMSWESLPQWKTLQRTTDERIFHETGMLFMAKDRDALTSDTFAMLQKVGIPHEKMERSELVARYPQIDFGPITWAVSEPQSGV